MQGMVSKALYVYVDVIPISALEPTTAPTVVTPLQNIMVRPGQPIHLVCEITGQPTPEISWQHDGRPVKPSEAQVR